MSAGILALAAVAAGCDPMADRMVDRHSTELAADLRVRGQLQRTAIETQFEGYRAAKHAEIAATARAALQTFEDLGRLTAASAEKTHATFDNLHRICDAKVDAAKAIALQQTASFNHAADTVLATMEYHQTKDAAMVEGFKAGLEAFGATYAAAKSEPADESEAKAQALIEQLNTQLTSMLQAYVGVIAPR